MDLAKRDLTLTYGNRTFAVRAYPDGGGAEGPGWYAVIIENRTPLRHAQRPHPTPADCFAEAIRFLTTIVEAKEDTPALPANPGAPGWSVRDGSEAHPSLRRVIEVGTNR